MLAPLRSLSLEVLRDVPAVLVFSTTFSATFWPLPTAFSVASLAALLALADEDLALPPAFLAAALALLPAFLAEAVAFSPAFLAAALVLLAALAAVKTFLATATERPAFFRSPALALAILATVPNFAAVSFFAVASPTPGSEVSGELFVFFAIFSPI